MKPIMSAGESESLESQSILTVRVETRSHRLRNQLEGIIASVGGLRVKSIDEKGGLRPLHRRFG